MVDRMQHYTYMNKTNRDNKYKELKRQGLNVYRSSIRNQLLHPMYVIDYPNKDEKNDTGIGNTLYKTHFSVLYTVEVRSY